jgi:hypothetical protein
VDWEEGDTRTLFMTEETKPMSHADKIKRGREENENNRNTLEALKGLPEMVASQGVQLNRIETLLKALSPSALLPPPPGQDGIAHVVDPLGAPKAVAVSGVRLPSRPTA